MQHWVITERLRRAGGQRELYGAESVVQVGTDGRRKEHSLGFTVPCRTTPSCFASSVLCAMASVHMWESTNV